MKLFQDSEHYEIISLCDWCEYRNFKLFHIVLFALEIETLKNVIYISLLNIYKNVKYHFDGGAECQIWGSGPLKFFSNKAPNKSISDFGGGAPDHFGMPGGAPAPPFSAPLQRYNMM